MPTGDFICSICKGWLANHRDGKPCEFIRKAPEYGEGYFIYNSNNYSMGEFETAHPRKQDRKYLPTLSELIDRLSIVQLKEVKIPEHKEEYAQEIKDIIHDIQLILDKSPKLDAETIRAIIVLAQMNGHIWENENKVRNNTGDGNLALTHGINGIRNTAKNKIQEINGGRKDYKVDCLAAEFKDWEISW